MKFTKIILFFMFIAIIYMIGFGNGQSSAYEKMRDDTHARPPININNQ